jgi:hypothetical protein
MLLTFLRQISLYLIVTLWLIGIGSGLGILLQYSTTPGESAASPAAWPAESKIQSAADLPTLLIFAHPHCPCTKATLGELEIIIARCPGRLSTHVLFIEPTGADAEWLDTELWKAAKGIPEVSVVADKDGLETKRFRAMTSGQALLYSPDGQLVFNGGITAARGHAGDNFGRDAIIDLVCSEHEMARQTGTFFVFGCSLQNVGANE